MPGRDFSSENYKFGFGGKESDDEIYGDKNELDYRARIYNPRLGRFLSIDPLAKSYPEFAPYQYASNRPIDGIDIDGLEYITYIFTVYSNTGAVVTNTIDYRDAEDFNYKRYSQSFGPEGRGIKYVYNFVDHNGNPTGKTSERWAQEQGGWNSITKSKWEYHGLFNGGGAISEVGPLFPSDNGDGMNTYKWGESPIDLPDAIAREHDIEMDDENYQEGDHKDPKYVGADIRMMKRSWLYLKESSKEGYVDPFTGKPPSKEARKAANNAYRYFSHEIKSKERSIQKQYNRDVISANEYYQWHMNKEKDLKENVTLPSK